MKRTIIAVYEDGVLRPEEPLAPTSGCRYAVTVDDQPSAPELSEREYPLRRYLQYAEDMGIEVQGATEQAGVLDDLLALTVDAGIDDLAAQHDHYLYGTPKR